MFSRSIIVNSWSIIDNSRSIIDDSRSVIDYPRRAIGDSYSIINYSRVTLQLVASFTIFIYNCYDRHVFTVKATGFVPE